MLTETDKPALRRMLSARRKAISSGERTAMETTILRRLFALPAWQCAATVCGYMSTRGEIDLLPVWREAVATGKTYALPVTVTGAQEGHMLFRATPGFCPDALTEGRFGIAEPPAHADFPVLPPNALSDALILVPGLGFDTEGFRIGYGGGYYDRFLDALTHAGVRVTTVGLCPAICRIEELPRATHDHAVNLVISEY